MAAPSIPNCSIEFEDEATGRCLMARATMVGADLVVAVGGGERPHVGCVVMAQPSGSRTPTCSVLTIPPHKEESLARDIAIRLSSEFGCVAVVTAGVHEDDLDAAGIETYLGLAKRLADALPTRIRELLARPPA